MESISLITLHIALRNLAVEKESVSMSWIKIEIIVLG